MPKTQYNSMKPKLRQTDMAVEVRIVVPLGYRYWLKGVEFLEF